MTEYTHQGNSVAAAPLCLRFEDVFVLKKFGEFSLLLPENTLKKKKKRILLGVGREKSYTALCDYMYIAFQFQNKVLCWYL